MLSSSNLDFIKTIGRGPHASVKQVKVSLLAFGQAFISDTALKVFRSAEVSTTLKLTNLVQNVATLIRVQGKNHVVGLYGVVWSKRAFPGLLIEYASFGNARKYISEHAKTRREKQKNQENKVEMRDFAIL